MPRSVVSVAGSRVPSVKEAHRMTKTKKTEFRPNDFVVYPAHGVGRIISIEEQEIAGLQLELFVISFEKDKMTLRVPTAQGDSRSACGRCRRPTS